MKNFFYRLAQSILVVAAIAGTGILMCLICLPH